MQKGDFMKDLVDKAVPANVDTLFNSMHTLNVRDRPPSIFQCQLRLFSQWFELWTDKERNEFMLKLQMTDPEFVANFDEQVKLASESSNSAMQNG